MQPTIVVLLSLSVLALTIQASPSARNPNNSKAIKSSQDAKKSLSIQSVNEAYHNGKHLDTDHASLELLPIRTEQIDGLQTAEHASSADNRFSTAISFLKKFGYMSKGNTFSNVGRDKAADLNRAIRSYQRFNGLPITGVIDSRTKADMNMPRCGLADVVSDEQPDEHGRTKRESVPDKGMIKKKKIKYVVSKPGSSIQIKQDKQEMIVRRAFKTWERYIDRQFIPQEFSGISTEPTNADFDVRFEIGEHGDGMRFDGNGDILGHAFYPIDEYSGKIHFDDKENWVPTGRELGRNLLWVATHEIGHALGLTHSAEPGAVMSAKYKGFNKVDVELSEDDINTLRAIYPKKKTCEEYSTKSRQQRCVMKLICANPTFDAIAQVPVHRQTDRTYFVQGNDLYEYDVESNTFQLPTTIGRVFKDIQSPSSLDAVITDQFKFTRVYSGKQVWEYDFMDQEEGETAPIVFSEKAKFENSYFKNIPEAKVDALFLMRHAGIQTEVLFVFQGNRYYKSITNDSPKQVLGSMNKIETISPSLKKIDAAIRYSDEEIYLFSGDNYYKVVLDERAYLKAEEGYPRKSAEFFGCPGHRRRSLRH